MLYFIVSFLLWSVFLSFYFWCVQWNEKSRLVSCAFVTLYIQCKHWLSCLNSYNSHPRNRAQYIHTTQRLCGCVTMCECAVVLVADFVSSVSLIDIYSNYGTWLELAQLDAFVCVCIWANFMLIRIDLETLFTTSQSSEFLYFFVMISAKINILDIFIKSNSIFRLISEVFNYFYGKYGKWRPFSPSNESSNWILHYAETFTLFRIPLTYVIMLWLFYAYIYFVNSHWMIKYSMFSLY